jgi:DNA repair protein RadC
MSHNTLNLFSFNEVQVTYHTKQLGPKITSSRDAYDFLIDRWENIEYCEKFYVILLNRANKVQGVAFISEGSVGGTVADPKKIFQIALKANASAIILAHNHPSGSIRPSQPDNSITEKCKEAGRFLDLPVMDHVIVTKDSYFSFADEGLI